MSDTLSAASTKTCPYERFVKPFLTPYYFTVAGVLGGITAVFAVVTVLLILVVTNFNILDWIE
ncbi:MAG TPA: hypothetical protein VL981_12490 [Candidatus Methylacidiphilales bacterium]|nr:hypothetical protein [Candidatus Methylacidiphilales bacterium]